MFEGEYINTSINKIIRIEIVYNRYKNLNYYLKVNLVGLSTNVSICNV